MAASLVALFVRTGNQLPGVVPPMTSADIGGTPMPTELTGETLRDARATPKPFRKVRCARFRAFLCFSWPWGRRGAGQLVARLVKA